MNGIVINIDPVIFQLGGFSLRWYSLTFAAGIGVAVLLVMKQAKQMRLDTNKVANVAIWAVVGGLVGARLFHVLDRFGYYSQNPAEILMINHGGLAIWGGLASGGVVALVAAWREGIPVRALADATPVAMVVGQMIGRIGCIINGDAYGGPTGMPWGFVYTHPGAMLPDSLRGVPTHPYPAYEILWDTVLLGLLLMLRRRGLPQGFLLLTYVAVYALGRFSLTFVRQEAIVLAGLQQAQVIALISLALSAAGMVALVKRQRGARGLQRSGSAVGGRRR